MVECEVKVITCVGMEILGEWLPFLTSARPASSDRRLSTAGPSNEDHPHDLSSSNDSFDDDQGVILILTPFSINTEDSVGYRHCLFIV